MEIITYGCQPNIKITLQSKSYSELRKLLFTLDSLSRDMGYLTINDIFNLTGHITPICYVYSRLGWHGCTCFGNGPIGEKKSPYDGTTVYYYNCDPTVDLDDVVKIEFKSAITKASKDDKIQKAYNALTRVYCKDEADDSEIAYALQEAIGYLGEVLE